MPIKNIFYKAFCTTPQRYYASISPKKKVFFCRSVAPSMFAYNLDSVCFHEIVATNVSSPSTTTTTWRATSTSNSKASISSPTTTSTTSSTFTSSTPIITTRKVILTFHTIFKTVIEYDTTTSLHTLYSLLRQQVRHIFLEQEYQLKKQARQQYYRNKIKFHHHHQNIHSSYHPSSSLNEPSYQQNITLQLKKMYHSSSSSSPSLPPPPIISISFKPRSTRSSILSLSNVNNNNNNNVKRIKKNTILKMARWIHTSSNQGQPMPHMPHPPSKAELLAQTRTFFERLKVRIKWPLMRQMRPWTLNDITALFSWLFLGHTVWLLVGTTSFVSLILWLANSLQFQGKLNNNNKIKIKSGLTCINVIFFKNIK